MFKNKAIYITIAVIILVVIINLVSTYFVNRKYNLNTSPSMEEKNVEPKILRRR